jgi:arylsulfatase A-like enzyme
LDKEYGAENYLLFLTSDHAVAENPAYLKDNFKSDAEAFSAGIVRSRIDSALSVKFGQGQWVAYTNGEQIWFNEKELREKNMTTEVAAKEAKKFLMTLDPVYAVFTKEELENQAHEEKFAKMAFASAHPKSAPDLYTVYKPQFINSSSPRGTTHGSPYAYDTQAPLVFFGQNIPKGKKTVKRVEITDIVPTLCLLLRLQFPACVTGEPIEPIFEK